MSDVKVRFTENTKALIRAKDDAVTRALEIIGIMAEGYAKGTVRVDTGNLKGSIDHTVDDNKMTIGTNVEYGLYQEVGKSGNYSYRPYLRPAIQDHSSEYKQVIVGQLQSI